MSKRRSKRKKGYYSKKRSSVRSRTPSDGVQLITPEGDGIVFTSAHYHHAAQEEISAILQQAGDFDLEDTEGDPLNLIWFETRSDAPPQFAPLDRRILAHLTLTASTLEVEAFSHRRLTNCRQRLAQLIGDLVQLVDVQVKDMDEALREGPVVEPEPFVPPPEVIAELEEKMLRQWLEESIPALGGLTPREAAETPEGRQQLEELFDYIARMQERSPSPPGMFSPDYRKAKKMLGLG